VLWPHHNPGLWVKKGERLGFAALLYKQAARKPLKARDGD
jgi:hypothetical protein